MRLTLKICVFSAISLYATFVIQGQSISQNPQTQCTTKSADFPALYELKIGMSLSDVMKVYPSATVKPKEENGVQEISANSFSTKKLSKSDLLAVDISLLDDKVAHFSFLYLGSEKLESVIMLIAKKFSTSAETRGDSSLTDVSVSCKDFTLTASTYGGNLSLYTKDYYQIIEQRRDGKREVKLPPPNQIATSEPIDKKTETSVAVIAERNRIVESQPSKITRNDQAEIVSTADGNEYETSNGAGVYAPLNPCKNADSPIIQGLRFGTKFADVKADSHLNFSKAAFRKTDGDRNFYSFLKPKKNVHALSLAFFNGNLGYISVEYDNGIEWKSLVEFTTYVSKSLNLDNTWNGNGYYYQTSYKLTCTNYTLETSKNKSGHMILVAVDTNALAKSQEKERQSLAKNREKEKQLLLKKNAEKARKKEAFTP